MRSALSILFFLTCSFHALSQSPSFSVDIANANGVVCYDATLQLSASTSDADIYELQTFNAGSWSTFGGYTGSAGSGSILVSINNYTSTNTFRFRIVNNTSGDEAFSSSLTVSPQQPQISFQPIDLVGCNGDDAFFRVGATGSGVLQYQWQVSESGGAFSNATASTYKNSNTANLEVDKLNNGDDDRTFRVVITDAEGCEVTSNVAGVSVNRHSSPLPTTSTPYCQGDSVMLMAQNVVGTVDSYQWRMATGTSSSYATITNGIKYSGVDAASLTIRDIQPDERNYQLIVNFTEISMDASGNAINGTCDVRTTRRGYVINARPLFTGAIVNDSPKCEGETADLSVTGTAGIVKWYTDSTAAAVFTGSAYTTPTLTSTQKFFVTETNTDGCESFFQEVEVVVNPEPVVSNLIANPVCPSANSFNLGYALSSPADQISISAGTNALAGFTPLNSVALSANPFSVSIPSNSISGTYDFDVTVQNSTSTCESDQQSFTLNIQQATAITSEPVDSTVCENASVSFSMVAVGEGTLTYEWFFNGVAIPSSNSATYSIASVTNAQVGNYYCRVTGACGTIQSNTVQLSLKTPVVISRQAANRRICQFEDTYFEIEATGTGSLTYQWYRNGSAISGANSNRLSLTNVLISEHNTTYYCIVTGECNTVQSETRTLEVYLAPAAPAVSNVNYCQGDVASSLSFTPALGNSVFWFDASLNILSNAPTPSTGAAGTVTYYVAEFNNSTECQSPLTQVDATVNAALNGSITNTNPFICTSGTLNRSLSLTTSFSGGSGTYTYTWGGVGVDGASTSSVTVNGTGTYFVKVGSGACSDSLGIVVSNPVGNLVAPRLSIDGLNFPSSVAICTGGNLTIQAVHAVSGGTVNWYNTATTPTIALSGATRTFNSVNSPFNAYARVQKTSGGFTCESDLGEMAVTIAEQPKVTAVIVNESCNATSDGSIVLTPNSGNTPFTYAIGSGSFGSTNSFTGLSAGNYNFKIRNSLGCISDTTITVGGTQQPTFSTQPVSLNNCKGNTVTFEAVVANQTSLQWQKQNGTTWEDLLGETTSELRITNVGNSTNPHLSQYRLRALNGTCESISDEVTLTVNSISGSIANQDLCEGGSFTFSTSDFTVVGTPSNVQWQFRAGTSGSWTNILGATSNSFAISNASVSDQGYYRLRITFDKGDGSTCVENSTTGNGTLINVVQVSNTTLTGTSTICAGGSATLMATGCNGTVTWSTAATGTSLTVSPTVNTTYTATCAVGSCSKAADNSVTVTVSGSIAAPTISADLIELCEKDSVTLTATGCSDTVEWSNGATGLSQKVRPAVNTTYTAVCKNTICSSANSNAIDIKLSQALHAGSIGEVNGDFCAGYNPPTISNTTNASGGFDGETLVYFWQQSDGCTGTWTSIDGASSTTYNPSALSTTTCFRRAVRSKCDTVYSNTSTITIKPDPTISVVANKTEICSNEAVVFTASVVGGAGLCPITWQVNAKSGAPSSSFWEDITDTGSIVTLASITNSATSNANYYVRAIVDCAPSSCNKATSDAASVIVRPSVNFILNTTDTTICSGNSVPLELVGCGGTVTWADGGTGNPRVVSPSLNTTYTATCSNSCGSTSQSAIVKVVPGLAMPLSTTPDSAVVPNLLTFSATGTNLKWYADSLTSVFSATPPSFDAVGTYTYWVSQSDALCESPRLKITARVYEPLRIVRMANDQYDCEGNSVKFDVEAVGVGQLYYYWQRKRPEDSDWVYLKEDDPNVKNVNTPFLTVSNVGRTQNPNESLYRCQVIDQVGTITTEPRKLIANVLFGSLPNFDACVGNSYEIVLRNSITVVGDVEKFQWQKRIGSDWTDLEDKDYITGTNSDVLKFSQLFDWHSGRYRCRVYFKTGGFQCIENTDLSTLTVGAYPSRPVVTDEDYCQGKTTKTVRYRAEKDNDERWYNSLTQPIGSGTNKEPRPSSDSAGVITYYVSQISDEGCESERVPLRVTIHPKPQAPTSTTPPKVTEGETLVFSATGTNLKWYTSRTGRTFTREAPQYTEIDEYKHYVNQESEVGCESERSLIIAEIVGKLGFLEQPVSLSECEGNTVTFRVEGKGEGVLTYQWERKSPSQADFELIEGATEDFFRIADAGDEANPDGSLYRCTVSNGLESKVSNEVVLIVNSIKGTIPSQSICEGSSILIITEGFEVNGEVSKYLLQKQEGSTWNTVQESSNLSFRLDSVQKSTAGDYRIRVEFISEITRTCPRSSRAFEVIVLQPESVEIVSELTFCEFEPLETILGNLNLNSPTLFFSGSETTKVEDLQSLPDSGQVFVQFTSQSGCVQQSEYLSFRKENAPEITISDTLISSCVGITFDLGELGTAAYQWFEGDTPIAAPSVFSMVESKLFQVAAINVNSCLSRKVDVQLMSEFCIVDEGSGCQVSVVDSLDLNSWNFINAQNGKVVLAINPNGQELGEVKVDFQVSSNPREVVSKEGTIYLQRYFNIEAENEFNNPVCLRLFFTQDELSQNFQVIDNLEKRNEYSLVHYSGINEDCEVSNNDNFDEGVAFVEEVSIIPTTLNNDIVYFEFCTSSFSEFGLASNPFVDGVNLSLNETDQGIEITYSSAKEIRPLGYSVEKLVSTGIWVKLESTSNPAFDPLTSSGTSTYRLVYTDLDGVKKVAAQKEIQIQSSDPNCKVFPNPVAALNGVNVFLGNIELESYALRDVKGQKYTSLLTEQGDSLYKLEVPQAVVDAVYYLTIRGQDDQNCVLKIVKE